MKKIAFHSYQLGDRGTEICLYKYAKYNREILGNESVIISTSSRPTPSLDKFKEFETILYPDVWINDGKNTQLRNTLEKICDDKKITHFYAIKGGESDGFMPENTKRLAHNIFRMDQPHGDVYAGVCEYISKKHGGIHPFVYHIIEKESPDISDNLREKLNIPKDALVFGRHGGYDTFNFDFVKKAIYKILNTRSDIYFIFLNTQNFINHNHVKYIDWTMNENEKAMFINTCDAMIHGRMDGEIFSLSIAEFSVRNKPIFTWNPVTPPSYYDTGHIYTLKDSAFYYTNDNDLYNLFSNISKSDFENKNWNIYGDTYSPLNIMNQFNEVFLQ